MKDFYTDFILLKRYLIIDSLRLAGLRPELPTLDRGTPLAQPYQSVRQFETPDPHTTNHIHRLDPIHGTVILICVVQLKTGTGADVANTQLFIYVLMMPIEVFTLH